MGRDLQKKKRRSSRPKIRQPNKPKRLLNPLGNDIVAKNWNKKETLTQNYRRLGLTARLRGPVGGVEKTLSQVEAEKSGKGNNGASHQAQQRDPFAIVSTEQAVIGEARVERDENGKIVRILYDGQKGGRNRNPLNDPLNDLDSDSDSGSDDNNNNNNNNNNDNDDEGENGEDMAEERKERKRKSGEEWGGIQDDESRPAVIRLLEREAALPTVKRPRHMSQQEREWLERLVARHGDDTAAMARDRTLNPMQQTQADIARRLRKFTGKV